MTERQHEASGRPQHERMPLARLRTRITLLAPLSLLVVAWCWGRYPLSIAWQISAPLCVLLGIALRLWAAGYLKKRQELVCWGPFSYLRNPLYLGTFLIGCGFALLSGRWESLLLVVAVMCAVYLPAILYEEHLLREWFGAPYAAYCRAVPRFWPRLWRPYRRGEGAPYCWALLRYNQEHYHIAVQLAFLVGFYGIQLFKTLHPMD